MDNFQGSDFYRNFDKINQKEDRRQSRQLDNLIRHHHRHRFVYIIVLCTIMTLKFHFKTILNGIV